MRFIKSKPYHQLKHEVQVTSIYEPMKKVWNTDNISVVILSLIFESGISGKLIQFPF